MTPPPRMRLLTWQGWSTVNSVTRVKKVHPGWTAPANGAGGIVGGTLRGDVFGQHLTATANLSFEMSSGGQGGFWNSAGATFDMSVDPSLDLTFFEFQLSSGGPITVGISSLSNRHFTFIENTATGQRWQGLDLPTGLATRKIEVLVYAKGGTGGYLLLRVDGVNHAQAYGVNTTSVANADAYFTRAKWNNYDLGEVGIWVGVGGWGEGDVHSDTNGNPRVIPLLVDGQGFYTDGTGSAGGSHHLLVDEAVSNTTDSVSLPADVTSRESYALAALPGTATRVLGVSGAYFAKTDSAGQGLPVAFARSNPEAGIGINAEYRESSLSTYSSTTTFDQYFGGSWQKDFATGREFTVAGVNAMELGWRRSAATGGLWHVSSVAAEVLCYLAQPTALTSTAQRSLLVRKTHKRSILWQMWPRWGCPMFFTDHIAPLVVDGITYEPSGGFSATDQRAELGLKEADVDLTGIISSAKITVADILAGRYRQARLVQSLVDWQVPWAGAIKRRVWTIEDIEVDGESWRATVSGITARLATRVGDSYYPVCRFHLFDNDLPIPGVAPTWERGCKLQSMGYYRTFDVTGAITDRRIFTITVNGSPSLATGWFDNGVLIFVTGANTNVAGEIRGMTAGGVVTLQLPLPFDVASLNAGMIWPGCNFLKGRPVGSAGDCFDKYVNVQNWGGDDLIPGTDEANRGSSF